MMPPSSFFFLLVGLLGRIAAFAPRAVQNAAFAPSHHAQQVMACAPPVYQRPFSSVLLLSAKSNEEDYQDLVTGLIADDELIKFASKLGDIVRDSVFECAKRFQFTPDKIAREIDRRCKEEVAHMMGKKEFKLMDFIFALNKIGKEELREVAGEADAEYDSMIKQVDKNVRSFLFDFTGKEDPDAEDIELALEDRVKARVMETFELPDFSLEGWAKDMDRKRQDYLVRSLGQWGADRANEATNMAMRTVTGKKTYEFGDLTRKIAADIFGSDKKK